jgi:ELWxxDGT repeat protein
MSNPWNALRRQLLLSFFILTSIAAFSQVSLVKDINGSDSKITGKIEHLTNSGGLTYFVKDSMLWVTSGSAVHTQPVIEGYQGFIKIDQLTPASGDRVYFVADHPETGSHLWISDGSSEGTYIVSTEMGSSPAPTSLMLVGETLYFSATDGISGRELWKTDGNISQTVRVKDILRGVGSSNPGDLENVNGTLYFAANDGTNGYELWKSDGTVSGTVMVKDIRTGAKLSSAPKHLTNVNGTLYFTAFDAINGRELWKSNGTATGTTLVKDIYAGSAESFPDNLTAVGSTLYFGAHNGTNGRELWKSNGTTTGTVLVKDINPGAASYSGGGFPHLSHFTVFNGTLYFITYTDRPRIWKTDGTAAGTIPVSPLNRNFIEINPNLTVFKGSLYYVVNGPTGFMEMWKTDGTEGNHQLVRNDLGKFLNKDMELTASSIFMYFTTWTDFSGSIEEFWYTDGTSANTAPLPYGMSYGSSYPSHLTTVGNHFYFSAQNGADEYGLFKSDGTKEGTDLLKAFPGKNLRSFFAGNGLLYFIEDNLSGEQVLWRSDGTVNGTYSLYLFNTQTLPVNYVMTGNGIVYVATANVLIRTTGTSASTFSLKSFPAHVGWMADAGDELVFAANNGVKGYELWKSNGTAAGTVLLRDIWTGANSSLIASAQPGGKAAVTLNGIAYFLANAGGDTNMELWRTDGTAAGTRMVKNDESGRPFNPINRLAVANNMVYVMTLDYSEEEDLNSHGVWKSDGTAAGTTMIKRIPFGPVYGEPEITMYSGASRLYFILHSSMAETFLWTSDGTEAGTNVIYEFGPITSLSPNHYAVNGETIYISGGYQQDSFIVRSNGSECGTFSVPLGIDEGGAIANVYLTTLNDILYFPAFDGNLGTELYRYIDNAGSCVDSNIAMQGRMDTDNNTAIDHEMQVSSYPNPFTSEVTITVPGEEGKGYRLRISNVNGLFSEKRDDLLYNETYRFGANWSPGIYLLTIQTEKGRIIQKIVKSKM